MDVQNLDPKAKVRLAIIVEEFTKEVVSHYLTNNNGEVALTATTLGVSRTTLHMMIQRLGLSHLKKRKPKFK